MTAIGIVGFAGVGGCLHGHWLAFPTKGVAGCHFTLGVSLLNGGLKARDTNHQLLQNQYKQTVEELFNKVASFIINDPNDPYLYPCAGRKVFAYCGLGYARICGVWVQTIAFSVLGLPTGFGIAFGLGWNVSGFWTGTLLALCMAVWIELVFIKSVNWRCCVQEAQREMSAAEN